MKEKKEVPLNLKNRKARYRRISGDLENAVFLSDFSMTIEKDCEKHGIPIEKAPEIWAMGIENFILFRAVVNDREEIEIWGNQIRRGNG